VISLILKVMYEDNSWVTYLYDDYGFQLRRSDYFYFKREAVNLAREMKKEKEKEKEKYNIEIYDKKGKLASKIGKFYSTNN
jgi:hypothetical protein